MFEKQSNEGYGRPLAGIEQKTLVHGAKTLMVESVAVEVFSPVREEYLPRATL